MTAIPRQRAVSRTGYQHLPERVTDSIRAQQDASEVLIGWVQLAVVVLFGTLYLVSPKTFSDQSQFAPVPWVLGSYFVFTLARLFVSRRGRIPDWFLHLSVIIDMGLLFVLIWSFHLQYKQPPTFYLKAPTLLYVFIFIALRAMRFEARFVILAGVVAATGWSVLAVYAMVAGGGMDMVTRDYVYYMTSNSILIGAEIDKIVSILTVTFILAVAITRARQTLIRSVAEGTAAQDLSRFFSPEIARQITAAEHEIHVGQGEAREAAILMCDIRGFTSFSTTVSPDELMSSLAAYQALMVPIIRGHGGTIDKFMGDGIIATFGASATSETYAADAMRAIEEIMAAATAWNAERAAAGKPALPVGAAIASGPIIFGAVGDENRLEYTVIGDAVNLSAKLEKHNKTERVRALATSTAFELALAQGYRPAGDTEKRAARTIEGIDAPLDIVVMAA